jgi:hypothetical protein
MNREVCFVIGRGGLILWADAADGPFAIPDSRARWLAIWEMRGEVEEIAHTHPLGPLGFSLEDETTMEALDQALGRALRYSVLAPQGMIARQGIFTERVDIQPWWANILRVASGME